MAHPVQQQFCEKVKRLFPKLFKGVKVIDIGSLDINGNNKYLFEKSEYVGLDIIEGKNVDVVSVAHEYDAPAESFDVVVSTNAMEHDMFYPRTLYKMVNLLRPGGLMFFSVANGWKEHGTSHTSPTQSATSQMSKEWAVYYKNLQPDDITDVLNLDDIFEKYELKIENKDLQFWGIKKSLQ